MAEDDLLSYVAFGTCGPSFSTSWDEWTPDEEQRRRFINEAWLTDQGIELKPIGGSQLEAVYPWGTVGSYYDFKNGTWATSLAYTIWGSAAQAALIP